MKKLLELLVTILITTSAAGSLVANKPNNKIKNSLETLYRKKRQTTPSNEQQTTTSQDSEIEFIEEEIILNENYSDNIQKILKELIKNNQFDPLRTINNEGIVRTDYFETQDKRNERESNIKIIEKLEKILELRKFDANKIRILVLTLKNKDNNEIKLIINLDNFYLQGFINKNNQYFYFKEEKSLNEWKQEIKKLTEELNEWNKINEIIKLLDLKKLNNSQHIINKIDEIKENIKKQWGVKKYRENKEKIDLLNKNLFNKIEINNQDLKNISKLNELRKKVEILNKEKIYLGEDKEKVNVYQKIQQIRQNALNLLNTGKIKSEIKKEYEESIKKYQWDNVFNKIASNIESKINTIQYKKIKENKINEKIIKKYSISENKKHKLNYNGSYQNKGLNSVNQNIDITKINLNNAILDLSKINNDNKENQKTKDNLTQIIFITSEAMRFGSYIKYFNYEKNNKQVEFKNIPENIQYIINSINNDKIQWKDYSEQLIGGWIEASKYLEQKKKEIFQNLKLFMTYFMIQDRIIKKIKINRKELIFNENGLKIIIELFFNIIKKNSFLNPDQKLIKIWEEQIEKLKKEEEKNKEQIKNLNKLINREKQIKSRVLMLLQSIFLRIIKIVEINELFMICYYDKKITYNELNNMEEIPLLSVLVIENNLDLIKLLIWKKPEIINATNKSGNTALHYACLFDVMDKKIDQEMINEKIKDIDGYLRLISQSKISNDEIEENKNNLLIQFLLENSPKEIINKPNKSGNIPLHLATYSNNIKAVELFIQKAKELYGEQSQQFKDFINARNNFNNTALHLAIQQFGTLQFKNINIVKLLLENGAEINTQNNDNITPLHAASFNNNIKVVELLIKEAKKLYKGGASEEFKKFINIKSKKYKMSSPIHAAIHQNNIEIVKLLLENGADDNIEMIYQSLNCCKEKNNKYDSKKQREKVLDFLEKYYELNKKIKKDEEFIKNLSEKFTLEQKEQLKKKIKKRIEINRKELNELLQIQLSDVITKTDLGELPDNNSPETILNKLRELNPNLDINQVKVHENSITDTAASIELIDKIYPDDTVKVTFTLTKKTDNSNYTQKQKNDDFENNIGNKKNYPVKSQSIKSVNSSGMQNQNNLYDVLPDNSCLFWSVATAYLLPVRNNDKKFKTRFIQLFGEENLKYLQLIQKLLKQYDLENNRNLNQLWYQNQIANNLITNAFRNRVVDYIEINLDTIANANSRLTFRNLIQDNNEIAFNYLESMRQPLTWGGVPEIIAMANMLNTNISIDNDSPYQPVNQNSNNNINLSYVELKEGSGVKNHYNFDLSEETRNTKEEFRNANVVNEQQPTENSREVDTKLEQQSCPNSLDSTPNSNSSKNKLPVDDHSQYHQTITKNDDNNNGNSAIKKAINKYNELSKDEKQQKLNEINQHFQSLPENEKKEYKDKLKSIGSAALGGGISAVGTAITISGKTASATSSLTAAEAIEMTPLLTEGTAVATEGTIIGGEAAIAGGLAPETLGLSLLIGGLAIAGTAVIWWLSDHDNSQSEKHEKDNQYNEIEKYYKFLKHDQLKLDINSETWDKIKQIYQENKNNFEIFKNKIKSEITSFYKEDHSGWGGSISDDDINILIKIMFNHFEEIDNHFTNNSNHGWKIITNTIGSYFQLDSE